MLAFPTPAEYRIKDIQAKAAFVQREVPPQKLPEPLAAEKTIPRGSIRELTAQMSKDGPAKMRCAAGQVVGGYGLGRTTTGVDDGPALTGPRGLGETGAGGTRRTQCSEGLDAQADRLPKTRWRGRRWWRRTLIAAQMGTRDNSDAGLPRGIQRLGLRSLAFLPVMTGSMVDSLEVSEAVPVGLVGVAGKDAENCAVPASWRPSTAAVHRGLRCAVRRYDLTTTGRQADGEF